MPIMTGTVKYCIIGTGFAGTCTLWHLVQRLTDPRRLPSLSPSAITIITVEQGPVNGPGYPYSRDNVQLAHRCNNQASTMAIYGNDFIDWMVRNKPWLIRDYPEVVLETHPRIELGEWKPHNDEFYPRALFGLYLEQRFQEAVDRARAHGIEVQQYVRHEAFDGYATDEGFSISLRGLDTNHKFTVGGLDRLLLSTGHWQSKATDALSGYDGYIASPYPPDMVKVAVADRIRSRRVRAERPCVFVQGMGPSGIDAIMTLCGEGEFTYTHDGHVAPYRPAAHAGEEPLRVAVGSRCGFFSPVRGQLANYEMHHLTEKRLAAIRRDHQGHLKIGPILDLLDMDLRRATRGAVGWNDIKNPPYCSAKEKLASDLQDSYTGNLVYTIFLKARRMRFYSQLEPCDKAIYDRLFDTHFIRTAVPMPAANAEKLLALIEAGVLTTVKQGYNAPEIVVGQDGEFLIPYQSSDGGQATLRADCVIRASAQDFSMERHPSPLLQNLLRRGEIVPHEEGGYVTGGIALDARGGYRVMKRVGDVCAPSPYLAAFGAPVRFWQNEHNFASAFVEAAEWVADDWLEAATAVGLRFAALGDPGFISAEIGR
jgi:hypothetical protein